jgi:hypothetical protein
LCIDRDELQQLSSKQTYTEETCAAPTSSSATSHASLDFDAELADLRRLVNSGNIAEYNERLAALASFIVRNSDANSPASLRAALRMPVSNAFAVWSEQTAQAELRFCNTKLLKSM